MNEQIINWRQRVEEDAENIIEEAKEWQKDNSDIDLLARFEDDEDGNPFYLEETLDSWGRFIYLDRENLKQYIDCLFELDEWGEIEDTLWDVGENFAQKISGLAFLTYKNALRYKIREKLKELKDSR